MDKLDAVPQPWKRANTIPNKMKKEGSTITDRQTAEQQKGRAEPGETRSNTNGRRLEFNISNYTNNKDKTYYGLNVKLKILSQM